MQQTLVYYICLENKFPQRIQKTFSLTLGFYAPPTIVEGHDVFWSVRPFICPSVRLSRFRLKFLVKVVFDEVEVQST